MMDSVEKRKSDDLQSGQLGKQCHLVTPLEQKGNP